MEKNTFFKTQKLVSNALKQVSGGTIFEFFFCALRKVSPMTLSWKGAAHKITTALGRSKSNNATANTATSAEDSQPPLSEWLSGQCI